MKIVLEHDNLKLIKWFKPSVCKGLEFLKIFLLISLLFVGCENEKKPDTDQQKESDSSTVKFDIVGQKSITTLKQGRFFFPRFSTDDSKIFFTSDQYAGLAYYQIKTGQIVILNDMPGAGYTLLFSPDAKKIYFRGEGPRKNRKRQYNLYEQDLQSKDIKRLLIEDVSDLSDLQLVTKDIVGFCTGDEQRLIPLYSKISDSLVVADFYQITQFNLTIWYQGKEVMTAEFKDHPLIWPQWSPVKDRFLIYATGLGLQMLNFADKTITNLGQMRAAKWSPKHNLIVYMSDRDNGVHITESDIYLYDINSRHSRNLTNTKTQIEMYPSWNFQGDEIVYHTSLGEIKSIKINIERMDL